MAVSSLKKGLERLKRLLWKPPGTPLEEWEEKLLHPPTEEYLVRAAYHGESPSHSNAELAQARGDTSHRGPETWEAIFSRGPWGKRGLSCPKSIRSVPVTEAQMGAFLQELTEEWEKLRALLKDVSLSDMYKDKGLVEEVEKTSPLSLHTAWYFTRTYEEWEEYRRECIGERECRYEDLLMEIAERLREKEE